MLRRPPGGGRWSTQQQKILLAIAFILIPWIQLAEAQRQQQQNPQAATLHADHHLRLQARRGDSDEDQLADDVGSHAWAAATAANIRSKETSESSNRNQRQEQQQQPQQQKLVPPRSNAYADAPAPAPAPNQKRHLPQYPPSDNKPNHIKVPNDASALATLAPAQSVRAPHPPRHLRPSSSASGLSSPQIARSLEDWEVEDFVLLATVDGDLYACDRKTGRQRWHLEVDQPMVESKHFRTNNSVLDDDYHAVDHYIWAVEPSRDGALYLWIPESSTGLVRTGFTMKRLVEELAPYADEEPPVVYTGDKKTTMVTLDAATGRVLKWFGSSGSQVMEGESCLRPNALYDNAENGECSSTGIITLGRTEYTVGIQRRDGRPIATLKYSEWGPNNFDNDLHQQYHTSIDSRYITSQHDGKVYAFDHSRTDHGAPLFSHRFSAPVARVFDVCRPWDAPSGSNPELVLLPQPPMPSRDEEMARTRSNSIFLNQTESGSWYALSGRAYPLIIDAPRARISRPGGWDMTYGWDTVNQAKISKALVGTHFLDPVRTNTYQQPPSLPGAIDGFYDDPENDSQNIADITAGASDEPTIITKVKSLPQSAANSAFALISNPILIIIFFCTLVLNQHKLRQSYHIYRTTGSIKHLYPYWLLDADISENDKGLVDHLVEGAAKAAVVAQVATEADKTQLLATPKVDDAAASLPSPPSSPKKDDTVDTEERAIKAAEAIQNNVTDELQDVAPPEKKKKAHRGRRGGVKHRKGRPREGSLSREDDPSNTTVDEAVNNAKKLGDRPNWEPDVVTIQNDMQAVTGPIISMGNIEVNTEVELGMGSNGTVVFAGKFDGRDVAVKRMTIQFYDIATRETRLLRESDDHPNVIRYYSQVMRGDFLYIALERCAASLADVVEKPNFFRELANAGQRDLPGVLYQITNGISHLHSLRIVHRDLKPQNILVNMDKGGRPRLLVSDFGLCKKLEGGQSSFGATTGRAAGTSGWRAPELLLDDDGRDAGILDGSTHSGSGSILVGDSAMANGRRATRAIDIFSLGLVFFYVLTNGSHPFDCGDRYMREVNIRKGNFNLSPLDSLGDFAYEAKDLISSMLESDPKRRPHAKDVMSHPFFWSAKKRLAFLCDVSDHFEKEQRDPPSPALEELERNAADITRGDFLRLLPREFIDSLGKQRKYTGSKLLDLLRALRNKRNHYEDMSDSLKKTVGSLPEGYLSFWTVRFPMLLIVCWNVVYNVRWEETDRFKDYYEPAGL